VNRQIIKLFGLIVVLFGILIAFTSWWSVFDAKALKEQKVNKRPLFEQQQIPRGRILAADGSVIAKSVPKGKGPNKRYERKYPLGGLFGHPIGYSFMEYGQTEFEQSHNAELTGEESEFGTILDELTGTKQEGEQVVTSLDPHAQEVALHALEGARAERHAGKRPRRADDRDDVAHHLVSHRGRVGKLTGAVEFGRIQHRADGVERRRGHAVPGKPKDRTLLRLVRVADVGLK